jgi:peptidoglycan/LPS O-acetylase OafA/YrhL
MQSPPPAAIPPRPARKPPLPALTGIRTLLAINIVLFHFTPPHMELLYPIINNGFIFVSVFFLISGFILTYNYADRATTLSKRDFWVARISRLYPVYLLALLISFDMLHAEWHARSHAQFWQGVLLTPFLLQGFNPSLATFWNTVAWTLSAEAVFYLAFPWLLRAPWPKSPPRLIALLLTLWIIGLIPHSLYIFLNPDHLTSPANRYTSTFWIHLLKYTPLPYVCTFLCGMILGKLQLAVAFTQRQRLLLAATSLTALLLFAYTLVPHVPYIIMHGGLLLPVFGALILGLSGPHFISSIFSWRPILLVGEASFCLYLLHFNGILLIRNYRLTERLHLSAFDPWISYIAVILLALAALRFVEAPARKAILRRFSPQHRALQPTSTL